MFRRVALLATYGAVGVTGAGDVVDRVKPGDVCVDGESQQAGNEGEG